MIRILVVDDHRLVRFGIRRMLESVTGFEIVGEAASGEAAVEQVRELHPDIVLMDVRMPGIGGIEATRRIVRAASATRVIAVTVCDDEPFPSRLLEAGASGYVTKSADHREITHAIRQVAAGNRFISADVARALALRNMEGDPASPFMTLSSREMQIAIMVVNCCKVRDISETLHLSPKTVNSYRYRIFDKLGIDGDVELTHMAVRHGLVDPDVALTAPDLVLAAAG
jgi:two-component system invasion response regulator UvrY